MKNTKWLYGIALMMIALSWGCSKFNDLKQKDSFTDTTKAYRQAILWSDFDYALSFHQTGSPDNSRIDPIYAKIKVTGYEEKYQSVSADGQKIEETVLIRYFWIDQMVEKSITANLVWQWDPISKNWYLISEFPRFE
jgi:hypothetical protein